MIANGQQPTDSLGARNSVKSPGTSGATPIRITGPPEAAHDSPTGAAAAHNRPQNDSAIAISGSPRLS